jgi:hypothetical protein
VLLRVLALSTFSQEPLSLAGSRHLAGTLAGTVEVVFCRKSRILIRILMFNSFLKSHLHCELP